MNVASRTPDVAPRGLQHTTARGPMPTRGRNLSFFTHTIGVRHGRAASGDQPSPRPTSRPRHRWLSPSGRNIMAGQSWLLRGILGPGDGLLPLQQGCRCARANGFGRLLPKTHRAREPSSSRRNSSRPEPLRNWLGSHSLPSTSQRAGRGSPRRQSPSPMEMEADHVPISSHGTRSRYDARVTRRVGRSRRRGWPPIRARKSREVENGRASGGLSHTPP